jgi:aromatic-L-amino-acid decarboxylase
MHGPQFSRGFAALKVWVSLLAHGRAAYGKRIAHDAALARYLGELVAEHPDFELMFEPRLSISRLRRSW